MPVTKEERDQFLRRHGWTPEFAEADRKKIEDYWGDYDEIEYAIEMGG